MGNTDFHHRTAERSFLFSDCTALPLSLYESKGLFPITHKPQNSVELSILTSRCTLGIVISYSDAPVSSFSVKSPSQVKSTSTTRDYFALKDAAFKNTLRHERLKCSLPLFGKTKHGVVFSCSTTCAGVCAYPVS